MRASARFAASLPVLGATSPIQGGLFGLTRSVARLAPVALDLPTDGGGRSAELHCYRTHGITRNHRARDLFPFGQGQRQSGAASALPVVLAVERPPLQNRRMPTLQLHPFRFRDPLAGKWVAPGTSFRCQSCSAAMRSGR
jgi:hypothetical protein